jgi:hypothetical protein
MRLVNTQSRQQLLSYFIPAETFQPLWTNVLEIIHRKQFTRFDDVRIFLDAKNLKLMTKAETWAGMRQRFAQLWDRTIDDQYVLTSYMDIGKETCPTASRSPRHGSSSSPQTLLWKRCCLEKYQHCSQPPECSRATFYPLSFLRDAGLLVLEPRPGSAPRRAGHLYSQFYDPVKESMAAGMHYPFSNVMLEALALDPQLLRTWQHLGRGGVKDIAISMRAYNHCKSRCDDAFKGSERKDFGVREEHRIRRDLFAEVDTEITRQGQAYAAFQISQRPFYIHQTSTILQWFRWNMNRLCAGFEMVRSLRHCEMVSWDHSWFMILCLRCLRLAYGGGGNHLWKSVGCWQDVQERSMPDGSQRRVEGMGL